MPLLVTMCNVHTIGCICTFALQNATLMHERDYDPNNGYLAWRLHVIGSNPRITYLCVAAHLKYMLMR